MAKRPSVVFSVSTWQQPTPSMPGTERSRVLDRVVEMIDSLHEHRLRIAIDEVGLRSFVEVIVDNTTFDRPRLVRPPH